MPQGFTATLDQFADCLARPEFSEQHACLLARRRMSESGQSIPQSRNASHKTAWRIGV